MKFKNIDPKVKSRNNTLKDLVTIFTISFLLISASNIIVDNAQGKSKTLIEHYSTSETTDIAYVTSEMLVVEKPGLMKEYKLPADEFFVSIAPYYNITHDCTVHYLTSCVGELFNESFKVLVKDKEGQIVIDKEMKSTKRGWINLWLPKNGTFEVTVTHADTSKTKTITTNPGDKTCVSDFYMK